MDYVAYVAKDPINQRGEARWGREGPLGWSASASRGPADAAPRPPACHILECCEGLAQSVISTVGQAFELRFKQYLHSPPRVVVPPGRYRPARPVPPHLCRPCPSSPGLGPCPLPALRPSWPTARPPGPHFRICKAGITTSPLPAEARAQGTGWRGVAFILSSLVRTGVAGASAKGRTARPAVSAIVAEGSQGGCVSSRRWAVCQQNCIYGHPKL